MTGPELCTNGISLRYVSGFKYLWQIISSDANDDADIRREVSNIFVRTNILSRELHKCSITIKSVLLV